MHGKDENSCAGELGPDDLGCLNSIEDRHGDIHQHHIRSVCFDSLDGICSIPCLSNDLQVRIFPKDVADRPPVQRAIVDNDNPNRCSCHKYLPRKRHE